MNVVSMERSRSGDAWANCSSRKRAGSILLGAVIAWSSFGSTVRGLQKITRWPPYTSSRPSPGRSHTTLADATSGCAINAAVEVIGDRWSLLVLRDVMFGNRRHFRVLQERSEEGIA